MARNIAEEMQDDGFTLRDIGRGGVTSYLRAGALSMVCGTCSRLQ